MNIRSRRTRSLAARPLQLMQLEDRLVPDVSAPAILQYFESTYPTIEKKTPDILLAGYGGVWMPPPGRADTGDQAVGYDVYNRFDLGSAGHYTLYGSETGLKSTVDSIHRIGDLFFSDLVWNHNGYSELSTPG